MHTTKKIAVYGDGSACCPWLDRDTYAKIKASFVSRKGARWVKFLLHEHEDLPMKWKLGMMAHICNPRAPERKNTGSGEPQARQPSQNGKFQAQWEASLKTESTQGKRLTVTSDLHMCIHAIDAQHTQRTSHCNANVKLFKDWNETIAEHTCIDLVSRLLTVWRWWISYCNVHASKTLILQSHKYLEVCLSSMRTKDEHIFIWSYSKSLRLTTLPK